MAIGYSYEWLAMYLGMLQVLIGCDGVNSVVSRWLGLSKPNYVGRSAIRGLSEFPGGHGFKSEFCQYNGNGYRCGFLPCDEKFVYWFFTYFSSQDRKSIS